ncbi:MAG: response regulator transcription factor [Lachnospiraceae bacterium]|nr:response regulator transcription factor [Lachnospiraceae bacterium]
MKNVIVIDDQVMSRQLFESIIKGAEGYNLLFALDSADLLDVYLTKYTVDLIIMDVVMQTGIDGLTASEKVKKINPDIKIIIVTSMPEVGYIKRAREIGVESFWYKEVQEAPLLEVIERTMKGESIYPGVIPKIQIGDIFSDDFTDAELLVLRELTTGASNQEIADKLFISVNTVRTHVTHMLEKTGFANRTELAIEARLSGIVIGDRKVVNDI